MRGLRVAGTAPWRRRGRALAALLTFSGTFLWAAQPVTAACHIITFEGDPYSVGEGEGHVRITVSNNGGQGTNQTVDYRTVDGSAKAGSDYQAKSGTLTFPGPPGDVSFDVPIMNDASDEPAQQFTVELSDLGGVCPGAQLSESSATVTIIDNDPKPQPPPPSTPIRSSTPKPKSSSTPTATPTPSETATPTVTPSSPTPTPTQTAVAAADEDGGGLSGGAVAGIVVGAAVIGGAAVILVRRRFLA